MFAGREAMGEEVQALFAKLGIHSKEKSTSASRRMVNAQRCGSAADRAE